MKAHDGESSTLPLPRAWDGTPDIYALYNAYNSGYTIIINRLQARWGPIAILCRSLEESLRHPVNINLYFTPRHSQGFSPHFDDHDVFILQLAGEKRWLLYDFQSKALPLATADRPVLKDEIGQPREEILLESGDVLYIPRGHIHEALSTSGSSLHLTVGVNVFRWVDLLEEALRVAAAENVRLREAVPSSLLQPGMPTREVMGPLHEVLRMLPWDRYGSAAIGRLTERMYEGRSPAPDGHFLSLDRIHEVDSTAVFLRRSGMTCSVSVSEGQACIQFPGNKVTGPLSIEPALNVIAKMERFSVQDLPGFLTEEAKLVLVRRLVREGLLSIAESDPQLTAMP
ncbi:MULTISPECIES: cupin domain-containing protein [unclassified Mycobacterium]|uniref:cupin domain-containing protein n=1 Tax=unclassified Mycobacterium TaxID=2642494 RepID=UPI000A7823B3